MSCASSSVCVAVDLDGMAQTWVQGTWSNPVTIDPGQNLTEVDCGGISYCVALDTVGNEMTYTGKWTAPQGLDGAPVNRADAADSVSCPNESFCTAVTMDGAALTYEHAYGPDASYFMAASDGEVFAFGSAQFEGSMAGAVLTRPVVGMANTHNGDGLLARRLRRWDVLVRRRQVPRVDGREISLQAGGRHGCHPERQGLLARRFRRGRLLVR